MTKQLIIAHANCLDGMTAAWIWKRFVWPDADVVWANYGTMPPDVDGKDVAILDFSYPLDQMIAMGRSAERIILLDHHEGAAATLNPRVSEDWIAAPSVGDAVDALTYGKHVQLIDQQHSGAGLAALVAEEMKPSEIDRVTDFPTWIWNVEDGDLWLFNLPRTKAVRAFLNCVPKTFESWDRLAQQFPTAADMAPLGETVLMREEQLIEEALNRSWTTMIDDVAVPIVDCPGSISSEVGHRLSDGHPNGVSLTFRYTMIGNDLCQKYSARSVPGCQMSARDLAQRFGGNGHEHSAGFTVEGSTCPL